MTTDGETVSVLWFSWRMCGCNGSPPTAVCSNQAAAVFLLLRHSPGVGRLIRQGKNKTHTDTARQHQQSHPTHGDSPHYCQHWMRSGLAQNRYSRWKSGGPLSVPPDDKLYKLYCGVVCTLRLSLAFPLPQHVSMNHFSPYLCTISLLTTLCYAAISPGPTRRPRHWPGPEKEGGSTEGSGRARGRSQK